MGTPDWFMPSPRLLTLRRVELGVVTVALAGSLVAVTALAAGARPALIVLAALLVIAACAEIFLRRRVRAWGYCERDEDLLVRRGVMVRRLSIVPYGRMQFVDVTAGPFERAFGLATVRMHTAAAASDARIPGLSAAEATRLRDRLATLGKAQAAGL